MAVLSGALTLADWASRVDDNHKIATIVELLSQTNEILADMLFVEANGVVSHKTTVRTGLPSATWRLLNYGVPTSKSTTAPITDTIGNLEAESQIDRDLARLNGNTAAFRLSESMAFIQSMNETMATTVIYGNGALNPERFTGLSPRYSLLSAPSGGNVLDAGGTGSDNTSIWLVNWGANTTHGITPKGWPTGLNHEDKGEWRVYDANNNPYWAYVDHYKWSIGLTVRDWRYNARIANIDVSDLAGGSAANLINLLVRLMHKVPTTNGLTAPVTTSDASGISGVMGRSAIYCNRTILSYLDMQAMNKTNVWLALGQHDGRAVTTFRGVPIRACDAILNTEARVV